MIAVYSILCFFIFAILTLTLAEYEKFKLALFALVMTLFSALILIEHIGTLFKS